MDKKPSDNRTVKLGIQLETTAGTKPTTFKLYENCYSISGSSNEAETIDVTPLEESKAHRYAKGLGDSGGNKTIGFFLDPEMGIITDWEDLISKAATARANGLACWMEKWYPGASKAYYCTIEPGALPDGDTSVASAAQIEISCVVNEEKGYLDAVEPLDSVTLNT